MTVRRFFHAVSLFLAVSVFALTICSHVGFAQRGKVLHGFSQSYPGAIAVGIQGGGNLNLGIDGPAAECNCSFEGGSGLGYHTGIHLDFYINRLLGLRLQGLFEDHSTEYSKDRTAELFDNDGTLRTVALERRSDIALRYVTTSFSAIWFTGPGGIFLITGVGVGFPVDGSIEEKEYITTPGLVFPTTGTTVITYRNEAIETNNEVGTRASLLVGLGYDLPLTRGITIAPELQADVPITSVVSGNANWRIPVFRGSLSLRFGL
jgi:hypothetical protein